MRLILGDCIEKMKELPSESVDCIITDPPYGINYRSNYGQRGYKLRIQTAREWDAQFNLEPYFLELMRVLKTPGHMYIFGTWKNFPVVSLLDGYKQTLVWDKRNTGMGDLTGWGIGYELIFMFSKGKRRVNVRRPPVIFAESLTSFSTGNPAAVYQHPTQKPVGIILPLLEVSTAPGDVVLDPFMGSGTTGVACLEQSRDFIGIEINPDYFKIAEQRINAARPTQMRLDL